VLAGAIAYATGNTVYIFGAVRAARSIHGRLIEAVLGTTMRSVPSSPYCGQSVVTRTVQMARHNPNISSYYSCYSRYPRL
jgi:hypothetical protein